MSSLRWLPGSRSRQRCRTLHRKMHAERTIPLCMGHDSPVFIIQDVGQMCTVFFKILCRSSAGSDRDISGPPGAEEGAVAKDLSQRDSSLASSRDSLQGISSRNPKGQKIPDRQKTQIGYMMEGEGRRGPSCRGRISGSKTRDSTPLFPLAGNGKEGSA